MKIPVLIPAYNPDRTLLSVVEGATKQGFETIIIVNDGSDAEADHVFEKLEKTEGCHVLHHAVNLGKGRALKTGFNYFYLNFPDSPGIVTADADGQHLPEDIAKVSRTFMNNSKAVVLGSRTFDKGTPRRSLIGNTITRYVFRFLVGRKISDTQSGLRCIPRHIVPDLIRLEGEKYEYEMNMLISTKTSHTVIIEEPITTVYIENNRSSHFNPFLDSMKIYFLLLRFSFSSAFASLIDFVIFSISFSISSNILTSIILARLVAGNVNFFINKNLVFQNKNSVAGTIIRYYMLFIVMGVLAFISIKTLAGFGMNVIAAKALTETALFFASFSIQRDFIFLNSKKTDAG